MKGVTFTACVACLLLVMTGSAVAAQPRVTPGSSYLALGDSVTFGYEESAVVPAPDYHNASSFISYPQRLAQALHLKVINAACPGETAASLTDVTGPSNGCESTPGNARAGYRRSFPLHVKYTGSQLAFAVSYLKAHRDVRLVSLMIGANDLLRCQETTKDGCRSELPPARATLAKNARRILSAVRNEAHYSGQLVIVNYYALNYASAAIRGQSVLLNSTVDRAAARFHVRLADGFGEWRLAAVHSGGDSCQAGLLTQTGPSSCGIHPSYAGQTLLAQALHDAIGL